MRHAPDLGARYTDAELNKLEKRIRKVYEEAGRDIDAKMADFAERHAKRDAKYRAQVAAGKMSQEDYEAWLQGQVFQGKQWSAKRDQIANTLYHANDTAQKMINGQTTNVFAFNANYMSYRMEHDAGVDFGFEMYDSATVTRLIKDDPNILPFKKLNKEKDVQWNWKNLRGQLTQGIIQGESIDKITSRLAKEVPNRNWKQMRTHARTAFTSAQNAGRQESLRAARAKGINVRKQWMATLDERTRWMHQVLDGQVQELDSPFEVGQYSIMYPGDPHASPAMVYNCRCTLVQSIADYPEEYKRRDNTNDEEISKMTYRDWEKYKKTAGAASAVSGEEKVYYNKDNDYTIQLDGYSEDVNSGLSKAAVKVAKMGSETGKEHLYLVNLSNGNLDFHESNELGGMVGFEFKNYLKEHPQEKFAFVHNHNVISPLSEADMRTVVTTEQIPVMIAVQNDSVKYIAERAGKAKTIDFDEFYKKDLMALNKQSRDGIITPIERLKKREEIIVNNSLRDFTKAKGADIRDGRR